MLTQRHLPSSWSCAAAGEQALLLASSPTLRSCHRLLARQCIVICPDMTVLCLAVGLQPRTCTTPARAGAALHVPAGSGGVDEAMRAPRSRLDCLNWAGGLSYAAVCTLPEQENYKMLP